MRSRSASFVGTTAPVVDPYDSDCLRNMRSAPTTSGMFAGILAAIVLAALFAPATALARESGEQTSEEDKPFSGAFYGPEAYVGYGWSDRGREIGSGTIGFRHSFVFLLGDTRLSYNFDDTLRGEGLDRHGIWLHTCLHPAAAVMLGSDWLAYLLSSPYLELGAGGLAYVGTETPAVASPAFGWSIGGGLDIPLSNPDRSSSPWLQLLYRHRIDASNRKRPAARPLADVFYLGIGWRLNGTLF